MIKKKRPFLHIKLATYSIPNKKKILKIKKQPSDLIPLPPIFCINMLLLALPFKTTTPILFHPALLPSLKAALPPNALPSLQASLSELDFLRNSKLEYGTLASQLPLNPNLHSEIEGNAIKLLRFK